MEKKIDQLLENQILIMEMLRRMTNYPHLDGESETAIEATERLRQAAVTSSNFFERWPLHWKLLYYFMGGIGVGVLASYCW